MKNTHPDWAHVTNLTAAGIAADVARVSAIDNHVLTLGRMTVGESGCKHDALHAAIAALRLQQWDLQKQIRSSRERLEFLRDQLTKSVAPWFEVPA